MDIIIIIVMIMIMISTVEIVPLEISTSMKPYPSDFHACSSTSRPVIVAFVTQGLDEVSDHIPPTSHATNPLRRAGRIYI